jgi:mannitol-1-phosphate 5-dehydrogenase
MTLSGSRTYVGFGFGAIQAGLFLYEAYQSGAFNRLVVAEVVPELVAAIRQAGGMYGLNIAQSDGIESVQIGPVDILNPNHPADREKLLDAIAAASEMGTAVPSIDFYTTSGEGSIHRLLAQGLQRKTVTNGPRAVIYTAENHNHAAEALESAVLSEITPANRDEVQASVRFLNTVIGKMSGALGSPTDMQDLLPITPQIARAFLVEAFNRILISKIDFGHQAAPFQRGISVFEEKNNLLPFEEAKLYGHNATHALAAYLGAFCGVERIADLRTLPGMMSFLRAAFIEESGAALLQKYAGQDPLFTASGYAHYVDDLLERMTNPFLGDTIERVARDPARKLGWDDRLIGTMRLAHTCNIRPRRYALGAAAALAMLDRPSLTDHDQAEAQLTRLWRDAKTTPAEHAAMLDFVNTGRLTLLRWQAAGFSDLRALTETG